MGFAAAQDSVVSGIVLLGVYSMGVGGTFPTVTALGIERFLRFYSRFRAHLHVVEVASGAFLIVLGVLLMFGRLTVLSNYLNFLNRFAL